MIPEIKKEWLSSFSWAKIIVIPMVLILAALSYAFDFSNGVELTTDGAESLIKIISGLLYVVLGLWGSYSVVANVADEIKQKTWTPMLLAQKSLWSFVWSKILASTIFVWYTVIILMLIKWSTAISMGFPIEIWKDCFDLFYGFLMNIIAFFLAVAMAKINSNQFSRIKELFVFILAALAVYFVMGIPFSSILLGRDIQWFEFEVNSVTSILFFVFWMGYFLWGSYTKLRKLTHFNDFPLFELVFPIVLSIYYFGFLKGNVEISSSNNIVSLFLMMTFVVVGVLIYLNLFFDAFLIQTFRKLKAFWKSDKIRFLKLYPMVFWYSLLLILIFCALMFFELDVQFILDKLRSFVPEKYISSGENFILSIRGVVVLMILRDVSLCLAYYFKFFEKIHPLFLFSILIMGYFFIPFVLVMLKQFGLAHLFVFLDQNYLWVTLTSLGIQIALFFGYSMYSFKKLK